jgi:hypothetical protein
MRAWCEASCELGARPHASFVRGFVRGRRAGPVRAPRRAAGRAAARAGGGVQTQLATKTAPRPRDSARARAPRRPRPRRPFITRPATRPLPPYKADLPRPSPRANRTRRVPARPTRRRRAAHERRRKAGTRAAGDGSMSTVCRAGVSDAAHPPPTDHGSDSSRPARGDAAGAVAPRAWGGVWLAPECGESATWWRRWILHPARAAAREAPAGAPAGRGQRGGGDFWQGRSPRGCCQVRGRACFPKVNLLSQLGPGGWQPEVDFWHGPPARVV